MFAHPNKQEMIDYIFWKEKLEISKRAIEEVHTKDGETINNVYISKWESWLVLEFRLLSTKDIFFTYEECEKNLQEKVEERQKTFKQLYWGEFVTNIVLSS